MKEWQCNGGDGCFVTEPCRCTMPDDMEPEVCLLNGIAEWEEVVAPGSASTNSASDEILHLLDNIETHCCSADIELVMCCVDEIRAKLRT